jgi:hypothetical protein
MFAAAFARQLASPVARAHGPRRRQLLASPVAHRMLVAVWTTAPLPLPPRQAQQQEL